VARSGVTGATIGGRGAGGVAGGGAGTHETQALSSNAPLAARAGEGSRRAPISGGRIMWLIVVEMLLALGLAVFIVWWTMFHRPKDRTPPASSEAEHRDQ
jgi:hypothetical protein